MIVGTAGHVDHGKTTLVRLLTGVDTDRLKEEKARGITTDLGYAYMPGADGEAIGFIDVPGHESLVRTMVAGAAGIDFALLVVAADEGVKPQTREHVEVLRQLGVADGLVVVTKADRADGERRAAVVAEVAAVLEASALAGRPPLPVSATTGEGLAALRACLVAAASERAQRRASGIFRLAVDRSFTLKGVGTVVAGTAVSGRVVVDDIVTIMPGRVRARVRSLHVQNRTAREGSAGDRCALALVGVARDIVPRGSWLCGEAEPVETVRIDVDLRLAASEAKVFGRSTLAHVHCGASDVLARVTPLSTPMVAPGARCIAQIVLASPLPLRHGDRFVLRDAGARRTIGGGHVLDIRAPSRRRRTPERLARLAVLGEADASTAFAAVLATSPGIEDRAAFAADRSLSTDQIDAIVARLDLVALDAAGPRFVAARDTYEAIAARVRLHLAQTHTDAPELAGVAADRLRTLLSPATPKAAFAALVGHLVAERRLAQRGPWLHLPGHVARLGEEDRRMADLLLPLIEKERFRPPRVRDVGVALAVHESQVRHACKALARTGALVEIAVDHFFTRATVIEMAEVARRLTGANGRFTAAEFRDELCNGRKVAIQILDYFDRQGLTHRTGDLRRVVEKSQALFAEAGGE